MQTVYGMDQLQLTFEMIKDETLTQDVSDS